MPNDQLQAALLEGVVHVHFQKLDGTHRHMMATLNATMLPAQDPDSNKTTKSSPVRTDQVCVVWDTQAQSWRSFRWDSVQQWHVPALVSVS